LLAQRLNVKESEVIEMSQRMGGSDVSLESPVRADSEDEQKSFLPSDGPGIEDMAAGSQMKAKLAEMLLILKKNLNAKETMILEERLLTDEPLTLQNIADKFDISRERVRQIEVNLLKKMKKFFETEMPDIKDFFDGEDMVIQGGSDR
jgi:RNA polymerase sigma-32 factor